MKRLALLMMLLTSAVTSTAYGQVTNPLPQSRQQRGACPPPVTFCDTASDVGNEYICTGGAAAVYVCPTAGAGGGSGTASGGAPAFSAITGATNTTAAMVVGSGSTLTGRVGDCADDRVFCVGKEAGAEYSTICGMVSGTGGANSCGDLLDTCASGTAMYDAQSAGCSRTTPCLIHVNSGWYNECVAIDNITDASLVMDAGVLIRPTVTAITDVNGGVIRIGTATATLASTARIEITGGTVWNDAWSSPEASVQVSRESGMGAGIASNVQDIYIHGVTMVGNHDGGQVFASRLTTDLSPPRVTFANNKIIGGDALAFKGFGVFKAFDNEIISQPNYCESTNTAFLAARGASTPSGTGTTTTLLVAAADDPNIDRFYVGRKVTFTAVGSCAAAQAWIVNYVESTGTATYMPPTAFSSDATCTNGYTIAAVTHNGGAAYVNGDAIDSPCTDVDWSTMRGASTTTTYWKNTLIHISASDTPAPAADSLVLNNNHGTIYMNDFGPDPNGAAACTTQNHIAPLLIYGGSPHQDFFLDDFAAVSNINIDTPDNNGCVNPIAGVSFTGANTYSGTVVLKNVHVTINNRGDPDEEVVGLNAKSTGAAYTVQFDGALVDINNTVAAYAGTSVTVAQANNTLVSLGNITSPDAITTSGTILRMDGSVGGLTVTAAGAGAFASTVAASNLSGTNTGDVAAGRSLTLSGGTYDADAELYTQTKCLNVDPNSAVTDFLFWRTDNAITVTGVDCLVDSATSLVLTLKECDGNGGSCGTTEAAITCATTNTTEASGIDDAAIDAGDYIRVVMGAKTGTPTQGILCMTYTVND